MQKLVKRKMLEHEIEAFLTSAVSGCLTTNSGDTSPYPHSVPINFVYLGGRVYIHGSARATRLKRIEKDAHVSFVAWEDGALFHGAGACDTNIRYKSIVLKAKAELLTDHARKLEILQAVAAKYAAQFSGAEMPHGVVAATAVLELTPVDVCGVIND